jgi:hypothetical protein
MADLRPSELGTAPTLGTTFPASTSSPDLLLTIGTARRCDRSACQWFMSADPTLDGAATVFRLVPRTPFHRGDSELSLQTHSCCAPVPADLGSGGPDVAEPTAPVLPSCGRIRYRLDQAAVDAIVAGYAGSERGCGGDAVRGTQPSATAVISVRSTPQVRHLVADEERVRLAWTVR